MRPDDVAVAEREGEADGPVGQRGDREVGEDLRDHCAGVLRAREADLQEREARLHEHHEQGRDDDPERVDRHAVLKLAGHGGIRHVRVSHTWQRCAGERCPKQRRAGPSPHRSSSFEFHPSGMVVRAGRGVIVPVSKIPGRGFSIRSSTTLIHLYITTLTPAARPRAHVFDLAEPTAPWSISSSPICRDLAAHGDGAREFDEEALSDGSVSTARRSAAFRRSTSPTCCCSRSVHGHLRSVL